MPYKTHVGHVADVMNAHKSPGIAQTINGGQNCKCFLTKGSIGEKKSQRPKTFQSHHYH